MAGEKVGNVYAAALLDLAEQKKAGEAVEEEIAAIAGLLIADPGIWKFFRSEIIGPEENMRILKWL